MGAFLFLRAKCCVAVVAFLQKPNAFFSIKNEGKMIACDMVDMVYYIRIFM